MSSLNLYTSCFLKECNSRALNSWKSPVRAMYIFITFYQNYCDIKCQVQDRCSKKVIKYFDFLPCVFNGSGGGVGGDELNTGNSVGGFGGAYKTDKFEFKIDFLQVCLFFLL